MGLEIDAAGIEQDALADQRDVGRAAGLTAARLSAAPAQVGDARRCGRHCRARPPETRPRPGAAAAPASTRQRLRRWRRASSLQQLADRHWHRACWAAAPSVPAPGWPARALAAMRSISRVGAAYSSIVFRRQGSARRLRNAGSAKLSVQAAVSSASYHSAASAAVPPTRNPMRAGLARCQFAQQLAGEGKALEAAGAGFDVSQLHARSDGCWPVWCCATSVPAVWRARACPASVALRAVAAGTRHLLGQPARPVHRGRQRAAHRGALDAAAAPPGCSRAASFQTAPIDRRHCLTMLIKISDHAGRPRRGRCACAILTQRRGKLFRQRTGFPKSTRIATMNDVTPPQDVTAPQDLDPVETQEWLESIDSVLRAEGPERAHFLIERLIDHARRSGAYLPFGPTPPTSIRSSVRPAARVPGRSRARAAHRGLHPLECNGDGGAGQSQVRANTVATWPATPRRRRCMKLGSIISGARRATSIPATWCTSRATHRPASTRAPTWKGA